MTQFQPSLHVIDVFLRRPQKKANFLEPRFWLVDYPEVGRTSQYKRVTNPPDEP